MRTFILTVLTVLAFCMGLTQVFAMPTLQETIAYLNGTLEGVCQRTELHDGTPWRQQSYKYTIQSISYGVLTIQEEGIDQIHRHPRDPTIPPSLRFNNVILKIDIAPKIGVFAEQQVHNDYRPEHQELLEIRCQHGSECIQSRIISGPPSAVGKQFRHQEYHLKLCHLTRGEVLRIERAFRHAVNLGQAADDPFAD